MRKKALKAFRKVSCNNAEPFVTCPLISIFFCTAMEFRHADAFFFFFFSKKLVAVSMMYFFNGGA